MKFNQRQEYIIEFAKTKDFFQTKDLIVFLNGKFDVERITLIRDLSLLVSENVLEQSGKGRAVKYFFSKRNKIFEKINIEKYFEKNFENREVQANFNFEIFKILEENIFTNEEQEKL